MELREGYKFTDVGVIPMDWITYSVRDLIVLLTDYDANGSFSSVAENVKVYDYEEYAWYVRSTDLENNSSLNNVKYVDEPSYKFLKKTSLNGGELLFLKRGDIGNVYLFEMKTERATVAPNLYLLKLNQISESKYLFYYFVSKVGQRQLKSKNASSTLGALYKDDVKSIIVPLPPTKSEQTAIATALSDADALINSLSTLIAKKRNIKQGAMQQLLKPKEGWEVKTLGEIAFVNMGQSPLSEYYNSEGIGLPLVQGNADVENRKTIIRFYTSMITKKGKAGDIIMSVRAPVGEIAKATSECCLGRGVCSISFDNEYLYHYLIYFEKSWAKLSTGSTFDSVNSKQVKELEIPIPISKEEQTRIATILSDMDAEIQALVTKLEKYRKIKLGMMQNLLTGKIRLI
ncbi:MAG: restriction endonuclease subunit S [Bacteroidales bacterium]|jgi:type I restriction enzyme S subunit|nr:restriction endonuclease subunit S [Bacteroidales bacterium]